MPTDLAAALARRAARNRQEHVAVLLVPVLLGVLSVFAALESPAVAVSLRQFGMF